MGRIGEVICRTWQTADKMKRFRGRLEEEKVIVTENNWHDYIEDVIIVSIVWYILK